MQITLLLSLVAFIFLFAVTMLVALLEACGISIGIDMGILAYLTVGSECSIFFHLAIMAGSSCEDV